MKAHLPSSLLQEYWLWVPDASLHPHPYLRKLPFLWDPLVVTGKARPPWQLFLPSYPLLHDVMSPGYSLLRLAMKSTLLPTFGSSRSWVCIMVRTLSLLPLVFFLNSPQEFPSKSFMCLICLAIHFLSTLNCLT